MTAAETEYAETDDHELCGYTLTRGDTAFVHQHVVDNRRAGCAGGVCCKVVCGAVLRRVVTRRAA
jgi:hypothetical protein